MSAVKAQPIAVSKQTAAQLIDRSVDFIDDLIRTGQLPARKQQTAGGYGRIFIKVSDLEAYVDNLPDA